MLGLVWYVHRRLARRGGARPAARRKDPEAITVLGRQGLGSKAQLVIVQTEDARYVLAVTEQRVTVIDRLPVAAITDAAEPSPPAGAGQARADADRAETAPAGSFDSVLTAASEANPLERPYPLRERRRHDPLRGSILSAETWRQTAEALRRAR